MQIFEILHIPCFFFFCGRSFLIFQAAVGAPGPTTTYQTLRRQALQLIIYHAACPKAIKRQLKKRSTIFRDGLQSKNQKETRIQSGLFLAFYLAVMLFNQ